LLTDIETPKDDKRDLHEIVKTGAKLLFPAQLNQIKVHAEKEGPEKDVDFHISNGYVYIKSLVYKLSKVDWRWQMYHGAATFGKRVFTVRNQGHAMVAILDTVPELATKDNPDGLREVARCECKHLDERLRLWIIWVPICFKAITVNWIKLGT
jgi:hypothetical protein